LETPEALKRRKLDGGFFFFVVPDAQQAEGLVGIGDHCLTQQSLSNRQYQAQTLWFLSEGIQAMDLVFTVYLED